MSPEKTGQNDLSHSLREQAERFDVEAADYDLHHSNDAALEYRDRFYRNRLFDFDLRGLRVLDAMCATGIDTPYFIARGAHVEGLDISSRCAEIYETRFGRPCKVASVHDTGFPAGSFDAIFISGGFHHVSNMLSQSIGEMHRVLKIGGKLCFVEPNAESWIDKVRKAWYASDDRFGADERALSYTGEVKPFLSLGFEEQAHFAGGNIAYLAIQQANVLKTPPFVIKHFKSMLFGIERIVGATPFAPKMYFCARWKKIA